VLTVSCRGSDRNCTYAEAFSFTLNEGTMKVRSHFSGSVPYTRGAHTARKSNASISGSAQT